MPATTSVIGAATISGAPDRTAGEAVRSGRGVTGRGVRRVRRLLAATATWLRWAAQGELPGRLRHWRQQRADAAAVTASPLFDAAWYALIYSDVEPADAARHYVRQGAAEGRSPGPAFDGPWYLDQHPEAARARRNPLLHYLASRHDAPDAARIKPLREPQPPARPLTDDGYAAWLRDWDVGDRRDLAIGMPEPGKLVGVVRACEAVPEQPWCLLLAGDVALAPAALALLAQAALAPDIELLTADEDVRLPDGRRCRPRFQPAWDPDLLRATGYIGSGVAVRRSLLRQLGLARLPDLPALLLLLADRVSPARARHVPAVLFHASQPPVWPLPQARALLASSGIAAVPGPAGTLRLRHDLPDPAPPVSILVPTRDQPDLLARCVRGLLHATDYPAIEVIVLDNGSREARTARLLRRLQADPRVQVIAAPGPFDWSGLNNRGAAAARGALLLLMNNDVMVREPGWLREMAALACRPEVGAVGATLLYPNGRIQHAGVALHPPGLAAHLMRHTPAALLDAGAAPGCPAEVAAGAEMAHLRAVRAVAAVTGACVMLRREVFEAAGGLAAGTLRVAWNDIDLCLRLRARGLRVLCTPFARLTHLEGVSRGSDDNPAHAPALSADYAAMRRLWGAALSEDPWLNPNLGLIDERLVFASPPRWTPGAVTWSADAKPAGAVAG